MKNNYQEICRVLKERREYAQMSPAALGEFFGCGESLIEKWETGVEEPTITEALVLGKLYGISLDEMFSDFDVGSMIPTDCKERFDHAVRLHTFSRRWYD